MPFQEIALVVYINGMTSWGAAKWVVICEGNYSFEVGCLSESLTLFILF